MISKATVHSATVLINRRINAERAVTKFGLVCSSVADMVLHHLEGRHAVQEGSASRCDECRRFPSCYLVIAAQPCYGFCRDERISGESDRSSAHCHSKSEMGTGSDGVACFTKCVAECNFDCRHVRVHRGGPGARSD